MKTYIVQVKGANLMLVATIAQNKEMAYKKVKKVYPKALKTGIMLSSVHISNVKGFKIV